MSNKYWIWSCGRKETSWNFLRCHKSIKLKTFFDIQNGTTVKQDFPLSWKIHSSSGAIIPTRRRNCKNYVKSEDRICDTCRAGNKQTKEVYAKIIELKRKPLNENWHMWPYLTYVQPPKRYDPSKADV